MLTFKQFIEEQLRTPEKAKDFFDRIQKIYPRSIGSKLIHGLKFGTEHSIGQEQTKPLESLYMRIKHYPDNPNKRPEPTRKTIDVKNLSVTQPGIQGEVVKSYIDHFSKNPDAVENPGIHTFPGSGGEHNVGDGHHRLAALIALGHKEINVEHYEREK